MRKQYGLTLIEMMIALVIGGFILLIVFLAVPATQRSARNTERHKDASVLLAAILDLRTQSSNGALPGGCDNTQTDCFMHATPLAYYKNQDAAMVASFVHLDNPYSDSGAVVQADDPDTTEKITLYSYAICDEAGTSPIGQYASPQDIVAVYAIETMSGPAWQCVSV